MKTGIWIVALTIAAGAMHPAWAQPNDRGRGEEHANQAQQRGNGCNNGNLGNARPAQRNGPAPREIDRHGERGAGPDHQFYRGERLPDQYRNSQYVVNDWRGHHLSAPPRGYHWVQTGGDYVLVAIATGVILQLLLNNY